MLAATLLRRARYARRRVSRCGLDCSGFLTGGGSSWGEATGSSMDEGSPISIGMLMPGVSLIEPDSSGSVSLRSPGSPASLALRLVGACRCVRQFAQAVEFVGTFEGCVNKELPRFGVAVAINQCATRRHDRG